MPRQIIDLNVILYRRADEQMADPHVFVEDATWREGSRVCTRCGAHLHVNNPNEKCGRCRKRFRPRAP